MQCKYDTEALKESLFVPRNCVNASYLMDIYENIVGNEVDMVLQIDRNFDIEALMIDYREGEYGDYVITCKDDSPYTIILDIHKRYIASKSIIVNYLQACDYSKKSKFVSLHDIQITRLDLEENELRLKFTPQSCTTLIKTPNEIKAAALIREYHLNNPVETTSSVRNIVGTIAIDDILLDGTTILLSIDDGIDSHRLECDLSIVMSLIKPKSVVQDPLKFIQGVKIVNVIPSNE